jgi:hypothetical protein
VPIVDAQTHEVVEHVDNTGIASPALSETEPDISFAPPGRKLCVRHQRMADEGTNLKLQKVLTACVPWKYAILIHIT